jgi:hypothetical protein
MLSQHVLYHIYECIAFQKKKKKKKKKSPSGCSFIVDESKAGVGKAVKELER